MQAEILIFILVRAEPKKHFTDQAGLGPNCLLLYRPCRENNFFVRAGPVSGSNFNSNTGPCRVKNKICIGQAVLGPGPFFPVETPMVYHRCGEYLKEGTSDSALSHLFRGVSVPRVTSF